MKGVDSWVVIGVLTVLMVDSGQSYYYECDDDLHTTITEDPTYVEPVKIPNLVKDLQDDIVATTPNYFDKLMDGIEDLKTFECASMYKKKKDRRNRKVILNVKYRMQNDEIVDYPMEAELSQVYKGSSLRNCDECPDIVDRALAFRFFSKDGVYGVYTCSKGLYNYGKPEGFIKASYSLTRNAKKTGKKELSPDTKALIEEARAKAKALGIDIVEDVPFGCNTEPPRADLPSPTEVSPTEVSPTTVSPTEVSPTTVSPTEVSPTTVSPTEVSPTTVSPTEVSPTEVSPTEVSPTKVSPTEVPPTKVSPTKASPSEVSHTERSPKNLSPTSTALIHKYGIAMMILTVGGFAVLYGTR